MRFFNPTPAIKLKLCTHIFFGAWFRYNSVSNEIFTNQEIIGKLKYSKGYL